MIRNTYFDHPPTLTHTDHKLELCKLAPDDADPIKGLIVVQITSRDGLNIGGGNPLAIVRPGGDIQGPSTVEPPAAAVCHGDVTAPALANHQYHHHHHHHHQHNSVVPTDSQNPANHHHMLPGGVWEERKTDQGRCYYVNHNTKSTQWERPLLPAPPVPHQLGQQQRKHSEPRLGTAGSEMPSSPSPTSTSLSTIASATSNATPSTTSPGPAAAAVDVLCSMMCFSNVEDPAPAIGSAKANATENGCSVPPIASSTTENGNTSIGRHTVEPSTSGTFPVDSSAPPDAQSNAPGLGLSASASGSQLLSSPGASTVPSASGGDQQQQRRALHSRPGSQDDLWADVAEPSVGSVAGAGVGASAASATPSAPIQRESEAAATPAAATLPVDSTVASTASAAAAAAAAATAASPMSSAESSSRDASRGPPPTAADGNLQRMRKSTRSTGNCSDESSRRRNSRNIRMPIGGGGGSGSGGSAHATHCSSPAAAAAAAQHHLQQHRGEHSAQRTAMELPNGYGEFGYLGALGKQTN